MSPGRLSDFEALDIQGRPVRLADHAGHFRDFCSEY